MILFPTRKEVANEPEFHDWVEEVTEQLKDADHIILKRVPSDPKDYKRLKKELRKANWDLNGIRITPITSRNYGSVVIPVIMSALVLLLTPIPIMVKILIGSFLAGAFVECLSVRRHS